MELSSLYGFSFDRFSKLLFWALAGIAFVVGSFLLVYVAVHLALLIIAAVIVGFALYLVAVTIYYTIKYLIIGIILSIVFDEFRGKSGRRRW